MKVPVTNENSSGYITCDVLKVFNPFLYHLDGQIIW